jgi:hypothetical protein
MYHLEYYQNRTGYWSAIATAPTSAAAGDKDASNSTELSFFFCPPTIKRQLPDNLGS